MNLEHMAVVKGHYEVRRKMAQDNKYLWLILREWREVIEEMDKEIHRLREDD